MDKMKTIGFGFDPEECMNHFLVVIPNAKKGDYVQVFERFIWDDADEQTSELPDGLSEFKLKVEIHKNKWDKIAPTVESTLNGILKATKRKIGHFKIGKTPVERLLGKELMVLLWAIEDCDPSVIPNAIRNWQGLAREERWWLYTMTNAATGDARDKRGWRIALRYAITDNPVIERKIQRDLFEDSVDGLLQK